MSEPAPQIEDHRAERVAMLRELAEIGMELARDVGRQAKQADAPADLGLVFSRIARAVRQTLALEARLEEALQTRARAETSARLERTKSAVRHAVERAIEAEADDDDVVDLYTRLYERLQDDDDAAFLDRPIGEVVAAICKDLGVTFDPTLWQDDTAPRLTPATREGEDKGEGGAGPSPAPPDPPPTHDPPPYWQPSSA